MNFIKDNSYNMVKVFLTQIVMSFFGTMLAIATLNNPSLLLWSSILSVLIQLGVIYSILWDIGARDKIKIDGGRMRKIPEKGFLVALGGNVPNLILAFLMGIGVLIDTEGSQVMSLVCNAIARLINGSYLGILKTLENLVLNNVETGGTMRIIWWWFIVMVIPTVVAGGISYLMGSHDIRIIPVRRQGTTNEHPNMSDRK